MKNVNDTVTVQIACKMCGQVIFFPISATGYAKWKLGGEYIQDAMPDATPDQREMLISQICDKCWEKLDG